MLFNLTEEEFELFLRTKRQHSQKPGAVQAQRSYFRRFKKWFDGKEWDERNFMHFMASQVDDRGLSQETRNKYISMGRNIDRLLKADATNGFTSRVPKLKRITEVLSPEQIKEMAYVHVPYAKHQEFLNKRQRALIMLLGTRGCRISEALELPWRNVIEHPTKHILFEDTKNKEDREVPVDDELWDLIQDVPRRGDLVFPSKTGEQLRSGDVLTDLKKRADLVGIRINVYNHLFRHSWATTMKKKGVNVVDICRIAGWKKTDMLMRYDGSDLDYLATVMELHPLVQNKMSDLDKLQRVVKDMQKWYDPNQYRIEPCIANGEVTLTIKPLSI